jgi:hypothetical protein
MARAIASDRAFFFGRERFNKRKSASRADIFSRTMAAASGSSTFLAPGAAPLRRSPARSARARVRTTPTAKGQKGVRRVVSSPGQEQFPPGSTLGKMMNLRLNTINWRVLNDAADKLEGELASQPILGLVKAETLLRGVDALEKEGRGYREYILLRSLGLKMWFTHATSRGGVSDPRTRCAVGKALASPDGAFNIYRRILTHAPLAKAGNWEAFADGLAADARAAAEAATEEDLRTTKVRYDAAVTAAHFEFLDAEIAAAARVIEQAFEKTTTSDDNDDALVSAVALVPWMDPGDAPARASAAGGEAAAAAAADEPEDDVESMFGKKKKKKKMPSRVLRAATPSAAKNEATTAVFRDGLEKTLGKLVKKQAEPTFPETSAWNVGEKQATGSDAVAAAVAICLRLPPACVIVVPTDVFASALTFDLGVLGPDKRVVSAAAFVAEESEEANENENAVLLAFDPAAPGADAALAAAAAKAKASAASAAMLTVALAGGGACDAAEGPQGAAAARAEALERAAERAGA